ncbi:MAG TPA: site-specific DNA-methyltransferase [Chitinophagales bacterium]|nr:site-specific DNA-methyltransferase [Chitinophagales bacterium]
MTNLLHQLTQLLAQNPQFTDNGILIKSKIAELALQADPQLIKLLLTNDAAKKHFFVEVEGVWVFDKVKFQQFVNNKAFLPDTFTAFKNRIGLTANGAFIAESKEVVLAWPYKDCLLEGGQTKETDKRKEIFWNELLAPEEIDQLTSPKVFTRFFRYAPHAVHSATYINPQTDNFIIKGNNLPVLHSMLPAFANKVKLIYIDPPYNTGTDGFGYNDSFNHASWLTFMKNRLAVARQLLRPDGIIFVHIGDEEMHYLKVLMDEIFGRDFFVGTIPRKTRTGKSDVPFRFSQDYDWILVYTKNATPQTALFKRSIERKYYQSADFPDDEWRLNPITTQRTIYERPNADFTMVNPKNGKEYPVNPNRSWAVTKDTFHKYYAQHKIVFPGDYDFLNLNQPMLRVFKSEETEQKGEDFDKTFFSSDTININFEQLAKNTKNKNGTDEITALFGTKVFAYPKNETLLKIIIEGCTKEGDLVLDYHLGSGTTAAVAHKLNRRYIGIEQMDYIENITLERMKKVLAGDEAGISKEVNWQGGGEFVYMELLPTNEQLLNLISAANTDAELELIYLNHLPHAINLTYKTTPQLLAQATPHFNNLSLAEKRKILLSLLDKNMLYLPFSEIDDTDFGIDELTKQLNRQFYQGSG